MVEKENFSFKTVLSLIWAPILSIIGILIALAVYLTFQNNVIAAPLQNFDKMTVTDGFHKISLDSGQHWELSYEQNHDRIFEGIVRHSSMDHETNFPIISYDILVTSGDFASASLVSTSVENHHFSWVPLQNSTPKGTINLLHTVPKDQAIEERLVRIKNGDHVIVTGWDILRINGYSRKGDYIGYWTDEGCNTLLVTDVIIK
jgi:hypothetical protein